MSFSSPVYVSVGTVMTKLPLYIIPLSLFSFMPTGHCGVLSPPSAFLTRRIVSSDDEVALKAEECEECLPLEANRGIQRASIPLSGWPRGGRRRGGLGESGGC